MVRVIEFTVLSILVQQPQVGGGIGQAGAVMLAMDGQQPGRDIPHDAGGCRHPVDAAAALSVGADFPVQQKVIGRTITAFFHLCPGLGGDLLKGGPDARLLGAAAHQFPGSPVPQNGVDGINQNGFACAGFAGQHIKAGGEGYFGLFNHGDIFNF